MSEAIVLASSISVRALAADHRRAYAALLATRERLDRLQTDNALDDELSDPQAVRDALTTIHGSHARSEIEAYFAAESAANVAAYDEDDAWQRFSKIVPRTSLDASTWLAYMIEHAAKQDEVVTLRRALQHIGALLGERLVT